MDIRNLGQITAGNKVWTTRWQPGQRLAVQVLSLAENGEATILLDGEETPALLETATRAGDKFGVTVREVQDDALLLVRDAKQAGNSLMAQFPASAERGLNGSSLVEQALKVFAGENRPALLVLVQGETEVPATMEGMQKSLADLIPEWGEITAADFPERLVRLLKVLGLDYEHRLNQFDRLNEQFKQAELNDLKGTVKARLLSLLIGAKDGDAGLELATKLLRELTAQQLWFQSGARETAYMIWQFPVSEEDGYFNVRVAAEGGRKGKKVDHHHCHVAVGMETPSLGEVGVDAWFYQDTVNLKVLTNSPEMLAPLLQEVLPVTQVQLQKLGLNLGRVDNGYLDGDFQRFLRGQRPRGVDVQT